MKKVSIVLVVLAVLALASFAVYANCGKCESKSSCAQKASDTKSCAHGGDAKACSANQKDMMAAMEALQKDLATMDKGVPAADQAAFMKEHQANLKKFMDAHAACQKDCKMKEGAKEDPKSATKDAPKT
jgi:hypothetical protein